MSDRDKAKDDAAIIISASEIGEYEYCSRAWWYRHVVRLAPPTAEAATQQVGRFTRGKAAHAHHGRLVGQAALLRTVGVALALGGFLIIIAAILSALLLNS